MIIPNIWKKQKHVPNHQPVNKCSMMSLDYARWYMIMILYMNNHQFKTQTLFGIGMFTHLWAILVYRCWWIFGTSSIKRESQESRDWWYLMVWFPCHSIIISFVPRCPKLSFCTLTFDVHGIVETRNKHILALGPCMPHAKPGDMCTYSRMYPHTI